MVLLLLAGLCAGTAVLHGMSALILLEVESALVAVALAVGSVALSIAAGPSRPEGYRTFDRD